MRMTRLLPYRTLADSDVGWGGWWFERESARQPLPDLLPSWDYSANDRVGLSVEVEAAKVIDALGLDPSALELVVVADCPSMLRRLIERRRLTSSAHQTLDLGIDLPPGEVAQRLDLSAFVLLAESIEPQPRTASMQGSRVGTGPSQRLLLEGDASRFPTEAVSFSSMHFENAPWTVSALFDDLGDSFMGSVRLLVNDEHELGRAVLEPSADRPLQARLKLEVLRSLVALVAVQDLDDQEEFSPESIGEVVDSMCRLFLNRTVFEAVQMYQRNPLGFDRALHAGVNA